MSITVEVIRDIDRAAALAPAWDSLAERSSAQPTMTPGYVLNFWRHLGKGELAIVVALDDSGELRAVAPLHKRRLIGVNTARWIGHGTGVVGHVVSMPDDLLIRAAVWEAIAHRFAAAELVDVPQRDWDMLDGLPVLRTDLNRCPTATMKPGWELPDYLAGGPRKRARRELARTHKRLSEGNATSEIQMASSWPDVQALLAPVRSIYDAAEAETPRLHFLAGDYQTPFLHMLQDAAEHHRLDVFMATVNGEPAAFDILISVGHAGHAMLGRYDPGAREWGVGHLLIEAMAARVLDRNLQIFNLQLGDDPYKRAWSDGGEDLVRLVSAPRGPVRLVDRAVVARSWAQELAQRRG